MAESFNLQTFLNNYKNIGGYTYDPTNKDAAAKARMEEADIAKAEEAVKSSGFLTLTLSEKMAELGMGERVMQQFAETAINALAGAVSPLGDYLDKYENIFDQTAYNGEIQAYAKQMFFASQAMKADAADHTEGQNFVYTM